MQQIGLTGLLENSLTTKKSQGFISLAFFCKNSGFCIGWDNPRRFAPTKHGIGMREFSTLNLEGPVEHTQVEVTLQVEHFLGSPRPVVQLTTSLYSQSGSGSWCRSAEFPEN